MSLERPTTARFKVSGNTPSLRRRPASRPLTQERRRQRQQQQQEGDAERHPSSPGGAAAHAAPPSESRGRRAGRPRRGEDGPLYAAAGAVGASALANGREELPIHSWTALRGLGSLRIPAWIPLPAPERRRGVRALPQESRGREGALELQPGPLAAAQEGWLLG